MKTIKPESSISSVESYQFSAFCLILILPSIWFDLSVWLDNYTNQIFLPFVFVDGFLDPEHCRVLKYYRKNSSEARFHANYVQQFSSFIIKAEKFETHKQKEKTEIFYLISVSWRVRFVRARFGNASESRRQKKTQMSKNLLGMEWIDGRGLWWLMFRKFFSGVFELLVTHLSCSL
jgi:hypothetical protein